MKRYTCLVLDHDDTVVQSEETVNYPSFLEALAKLRPGQTIDLATFTRWCFSPGFAALCLERFGFSQAELNLQFEMWLQYVRTHIPPVFPGMGDIIRRQKAEGGLICVVSHSSQENILRDYRTHFDLEPDCIFGWELGNERRKPNPYPLDEIMKRYGLAASDMLMVDDLKPGYDMAKAQHVDFAWAGWGRSNVPEITAFMKANCKLLFETVGALEKYLFEA